MRRLILDLVFPKPVVYGTRNQVRFFQTQSQWAYVSARIYMYVQTLVYKCWFICKLWVYVTVNNTTLHRGCELNCMTSFPCQDKSVCVKYFSVQAKKSGAQPHKWRILIMNLRALSLEQLANLLT